MYTECCCTRTRASEKRFFSCCCCHQCFWVPPFIRVPHVGNVLIAIRFVEIGLSLSCVWFFRFCDFFVAPVPLGLRARQAFDSAVPSDKAEQDPRRREDDAARRPDLARSRGWGAPATPRVFAATVERGKGVPFHGRRDTGDPY